MLQMTSTVLKFHFKSELESASFGKSVLSLRGEGAERTLELTAAKSDGGRRKMMRRSSSSFESPQRVCMHDLGWQGRLCVCA